MCNCASTPKGGAKKAPLRRPKAGRRVRTELLHELQVHQVELDLQHEQVAATRREIDEDLARYKALYESAPVGYFNVDLLGRILEANVAGAELFRFDLADLSGRCLESLLAPAGRPVLLSLLPELRHQAQQYQ